MRYAIVIFLSLWTSALYADPEITVIVHSDNELGALTRKQIADIYMGRITSLPNGSIPLPLDYQGDSPARTRFYESITGKSMAQINAYWARLSFTGQASPPRRLPNKAAVMQVVGKNQDALGYVEEAAPDTRAGADAAPDSRVSPVINVK
jgi:ABC-type phosphate transport system substrate-binding protein